MKRGNWFKGPSGKEECWKGVTKTGGVRKKPFQKAGARSKLKKAATTVVFVPSTKGSTLIKSLRDEEDRMADITGFRIKYQEAGGNVLSNAFDKNLGKGLHCGGQHAHHVITLGKGKIVRAKIWSISLNGLSATPKPAWRMM